MRVISVAITSIGIGLLLAACMSSTEVASVKQIAPASVVGHPTALVPWLKVIGTEPFWAIDVDGSRLHYTTMDDQTGRYLVTQPEKIDGGSWRWRSQPAGTFELFITPGKCSDGMSDRNYAFTARFNIDQVEYRGCADDLSKFSGEAQQP